MKKVGAGIATAVLVLWLAVNMLDPILSPVLDRVIDDKNSQTMAMTLDSMWATQGPDDRVLMCNRYWQDPEPWLAQSWQIAEQADQAAGTSITSSNSARTTHDQWWASHCPTPRA